MKPHNYFVYAIVSMKDNRIYVGISEDVDRRINEHNKGRVSSTKAYIPWTLFYSEFTGAAKKAREMEIYYKSAAGKRKLRRILKFKFPA